MSEKVACPECKGSGKKVFGYNNVEPCRSCIGTGKLYKYTTKAHDRRKRMSEKLKTSSERAQSTLRQGKGLKDESCSL